MDVATTTQLITVNTDPPVAGLPRVDAPAGIAKPPRDRRRQRLSHSDSINPSELDSRLTRQFMTHEVKFASKAFTLWISRR
jgi:hypothetical protein